MTEHSKLKQSSNIISLKQLKQSSNIISLNQTQTTARRHHIQTNARTQTDSIV